MAVIATLKNSSSFILMMMLACFSLFHDVSKYYDVVDATNNDTLLAIYSTANDRSP
jgi:hypothetical protein